MILNVKTSGYNQNIGIILTGKVRYMGYDMSTGIFTDKMSSMGLFANIFGCYEIIKKCYFTFGLLFDYKFTRTEEGEVIVSGVSSKFSDSPQFSGFAVTPFIGFLARF